ncbi:MAG: C_GCAxxG_C_C family protein [Candidatus Heimdallarchaeota archaeon]|nr:C_GCAxxG_C_C family protein [Candidatus Heimdallarchaeota archaeon]
MVKFDLSNEIVRKAKENFPKYNCAQSVLKAILEHKELYFDQVTTLAAGFGGGISRRGEICGAVSGAIMAIGIIHGQQIKDPKEHKIVTYNSANEFIKKFNQIHNTVICNELIGFDISDSEAREKGNKEGIFENICPNFIESAIKIILEMFPE